MIGELYCLATSFVGRAILFGDHFSFKLHFKGQFLLGKLYSLVTVPEKVAFLSDDRVSYVSCAVW